MLLQQSISKSPTILTQYFAALSHIRILMKPTHIYAFSTTTPKTSIKKQKTLYQILEIPTTATPTNIKKNYLKLAKIYHPDIYKGSDKNRFQFIQNAYKILSNQRTKKQYDLKIGIKPKSSEEYMEDSPSARKENTANIDPQDFTSKNPFSYKTEIPQASSMNLDEEYEKFFSKKSTTHFEEIRMHQQNQFKAMSEAERVRRRFKQIYSDPIAQQKMNFSKTYPQALDDIIDQKNHHEVQIENKLKMQKKLESPVVTNRINLAIKIIGGIIATLMIPLFLSIKTKLLLERETQQKYDRFSEKFMNKAEEASIRSRFVFSNETQAKIK